LWKELPQIDILDEGMDPCPEFQGPTRFFPYAGIVPCIGVDCPKMGFPPVGKVDDKKVLLPNIPPCIGVDCPKMGLPPVGKAAGKKVLLPNISF
jgi:hypothetical protein